MARRNLSDSQIICISILWLFLCYMLLSTAQRITFDVIFALVASGIIVFVPIYKNIRHRNKK